MERPEDFLVEVHATPEQLLGGSYQIPQPPGTHDFAVRFTVPYEGKLYYTTANVTREFLVAVLEPERLLGREIIHSIQDFIRNEQHPNT